MTQGVVALIAVVLLATAFGLWRRFSDGRFRAADNDAKSTGDSLTAGELGQSLGDRATLVQFSSAFCAPCRATRVVLNEVAEHTPGVRHVELDAESHLELIRRFDVRRTPTLLVLDSRGVVRHRAAGATDRAHVLSALASVTS